MFYADFVLSKKGPLARIWLAAHWDKKLTKAQIFETNIESSVDKILKPKVKLALRTSGHLMLGVVRIYSRKAKYLLQDCNEAFVKIKMAFRPGMVDLPEDHREAAVNAVTLPEVFHDFDSAIPDLNEVDIETQFTLNQSRVDEITMHEEFNSEEQPVPTNPDDGFGDLFVISQQNNNNNQTVSNNNTSNDTLRHSEGPNQSAPQTNLLFEEVADRQKERMTIADNINLAMDLDMHEDGFGQIPEGESFGVGLFEDTPPLPNITMEGSLHMQDSLVLNIDRAGPSGSMPASPSSPAMRQIASDSRPPSTRLNDDDDYDDDHFIPSPGGVSSDGSRPPSPLSEIIAPTSMSTALPTEESEAAPTAEVAAAAESVATSAGPVMESEPAEQEDEEAEQHNEQTTLLQNEEESFALAPVDASVLRGLPKTKRKRKLIVDEIKNISGEEMKSQLGDTSDIVTTLDLAPPTKRLMHWKETGGVEKLFALPGRSIPSSVMFKNFQRHLTARPTLNEDGSEEKELTDHETEVSAPPTSRRGRKRKQPIVEEDSGSEQEEIPKRVRGERESNRLSMIVEEPPSLPVPEAVVEEEAQPEQPQPEQEIVAVPSPIPAPVIVEPKSVQPEVEPPLELQIPDLVEPASIPPVTTDAEMRVTIAEEPLEAPASNLMMSNFGESFGIGEMGFDDQPKESLEMALLNAEKAKNGENIDGVANAENAEIAKIASPPTLNDMMQNMGYDESDQLFNQALNESGQPQFTEEQDHAPVTPGINAGGSGATPFHEVDYDNPPSAGQVNYEELRLSNETVEQFEERLSNKRAGQLYAAIRNRIYNEVQITFDDLVISNSRKMIAQKFYSLLVLKKHKVLELYQSEPYATIKLSKGSNFDDPKL